MHPLFWEVVACVLAFVTVIFFLVICSPGSFERLTPIAFLLLLIGLLARLTEHLWGMGIGAVIGLIVYMFPIRQAMRREQNEV